MISIKKIVTLSVLFISCVLLTANQTDTESVANKYNVLFIGVDDLNDWTGYLGGHPQVRTPNIDRLAGAGVVFSHAYPSAPICGPSRTALLYGRYPHVTGSYGSSRFYSPYTLRNYANSTVIPDLWHSQKALPTVFRESGYYTAGAGKLSHFTQTPRYHSDVASFFKDEFDTYFDLPTSARVQPDQENPESHTERLSFGPVAPEDESQLLDLQFSDWAVEQLQQDYDMPFFLAIGFRKPHLPWVAPQSFFDQFDLSEILLPEVPENDLEDIPHAGKIFAQSEFLLDNLYPVSDHQYVTTHGLWERLVRAYLASISYADAMVGKVLDALEASSYADNTIVVLWGDHGWHLGEKKHWKKMTLWERSNRTPLIIRVPDNPANGQTVKPPVSLQDIFPTLVELADLKVDQSLDGNSLVPLLRDPGRDWDKPVLMSHGPGNFAIRSGFWRYIQYQNGDEELYNLQRDPGEFVNLAAGDDYEEEIEQLGRFIPDDYVELYDHRSLQYAKLDTMKIFIE